MFVLDNVHTPVMISVCSYGAQTRVAPKRVTSVPKCYACLKFENFALSIGVTVQTKIEPDRAIMDNEPSLLDTPKCLSIQSQASQIRIDLKDFERTFVEQNGRKPKQSDIKQNAEVAAKYKQYQRLQDVLSGRLEWDKLKPDTNETQNRKKIRAHSRQDSGVGTSPRRRSAHATPRKRDRRRDNEGFEQEDERPFLANAIGPTPHRDGRAVGLFDLLPHSGSGNCAAATPSSSARKRKIEELYEDTPAKTTRSPLAVIQTPSRRREQVLDRHQGDLLNYLSGTPQKSSLIHNCKHSRTPQSDGRKFQLSQFFATPSTQRFLFPVEEVPSAKKTPLRDLVLGSDVTPQREPDATALDETPKYLCRSTSFKDRLVAAIQPAVASSTSKPVFPVKRIGPPTLRHFRSSTSHVLKLSDFHDQPKAQQPQIQERADDQDGCDDHDDDLEALRELEDDNAGQAGRPRVLVEDSQLNLNPGSSSEPEVLVDELATIDQLVRKPYKKKGQKRTTRKASIRVAATTPKKQHSEPNFVDGNASADELVDETHFTDDNDFYDDQTDAGADDPDRERKKKVKRAAENRDKDKAKGKKKAGMINPNAQSHMNYKSLKIKNKQSKAKGAGRGKFGRGRRKGF